MTPYILRSLLKKCPPKIIFNSSGAVNQILYFKYQTAVLKNEHPLPSELMGLGPTQRINSMASLERMFDEGENQW